MTRGMFLQYMEPVVALLEESTGPAIDDAKAAARLLDDWARSRESIRGVEPPQGLSELIDVMRAVVDTQVGEDVPNARRALYALVEWARTAESDAMVQKTQMMEESPAYIAQQKALRELREEKAKAAHRRYAAGRYWTPSAADMEKLKQEQEAKKARARAEQNARALSR